MCLAQRGHSINYVDEMNRGDSEFGSSDITGEIGGIRETES